MLVRKFPVLGQKRKRFVFTFAFRASYPPAKIDETVTRYLTARDIYTAAEMDTLDMSIIFDK
jgi:hypothetical protein